MKEKITLEEIQKWRRRWKGKEGIIDELLKILGRDEPDISKDDSESYERLKKASDLLINNIEGYEEKEVKYPEVFYSLDLRGIDLSDRDVIGIDFKSARLQASKFNNSQFKDVKFYFADLREVEFKETSFENVTFIKTFLQGAFFWNPKRVSNVNFEMSFVEGTDFIDMDLTSCIFQDARFGEESVNIEFGPTIHSTYFKNCKFIPHWRDYLKDKSKWKSLIHHLFQPWFYTNFSDVNIDAADTVLAPDLYRYVKDQQYLRRFKQNHPNWYWLWKWTCGCGNSLLLWVIWCFLIILGFSLIYPDVIYDGSKHYCPLYYSFRTFMSLGFGDFAEIRGWIVIEIILGYVMLGGLISIFSNKLARRSG